MMGGFDPPPQLCQRWILFGHFKGWAMIQNMLRYKSLFCSLRF